VKTFNEWAGSRREDFGFGTAMRDFIEIANVASQHPHHGDPRKMKAYDILHRKYAESFENKEMKQSINFDYLGLAKAKTKWHEYLKSLGMTFNKNDGIFDPSCHLEWQQRYIQIPEDMMDKILTLGLP
jgi:hypothetical protein